MTDVKHDNTLIDEALSGNAGAFGELVQRYQDRLYNTMTHIVGSADDALDVVQEAFVQAFVKLDTFQRTAAFFTWLYRIAFNLSVTRRRRERPNRSIQELHETCGEEPADRGASPDDRLQQQEMAAQVQAGLAALSEEHRSILVLREVEGLSYDEIAEILGSPVGTVRSRLHRARLELRDQLKEVFQIDRP